jgi:hypothetical protein
MKNFIISTFLGLTIGLAAAIGAASAPFIEGDVTSNLTVPINANASLTYNVTLPPSKPSSPRS